MSIQRREIAEHAGVTPALVSYYFPDKARLLEQAAIAVIEDGVGRVTEVLQSRKPSLDVFRELVSTFIAVNVDQGHVLDHYLDMDAARRAETAEKIGKVKAEVRALMLDLIERGDIQEGDVGLIGAALWGACKHLGQQLDARHGLSDDESSRKIAASVETVLRMLQPGQQDTSPGP